MGITTHPATMKINHLHPQMTHNYVRTIQLGLTDTEGNPQKQQLPEDSGANTTSCAILAPCR